LSDDEFYWADLIGLEVENLQGEHLGTVTDMMSNGPQSILRIVPAEVEAQERLIPFVDAFIIKVDKAARRSSSTGALITKRKTLRAVRHAI
jgi:16S rRNA processing protein RimM